MKALMCSLEEVTGLQNVVPGIWPPLAADEDQLIKWQARAIAKPQYEARQVFNGELAIDAVKNPFGAVGDRLWVREHWNLESIHEDCLILSYADGFVRTVYEWKKQKVASKPGGKVRRYMPQWASRFELKIMELRTEHLLCISSADAKAEGFYNRYRFMQNWRAQHSYEDKLNFNQLYNPWVWVATLKRVA